MKEKPKNKRTNVDAEEWVVVPFVMHTAWRGMSQKKNRHVAVAASIATTTISHVKWKRNKKKTIDTFSIVHTLHDTCDSHSHHTSHYPYPSVQCNSNNIQFKSHEIAMRTHRRSEGIFYYALNWNHRTQWQTLRNFPFDRIQTINAIEYRNCTRKKKCLELNRETRECQRAWTRNEHRMHQSVRNNK